MTLQKYSFGFSKNVVDVISTSTLEKLLENAMVSAWLKSQESFAVKIDNAGSMHIYRDTTKGDVVQSENIIQTMNGHTWLSSPFWDATIRFDEELIVHAFTDTEYREHVRLEKVAGEELSRRHEEQIQHDNFVAEVPKTRGRQSRFDWTNLSDLILNDKKSLQEIADLFGCTIAAVRRRVKMQEIAMPVSKRGRRRKSEE